MKLQANEFQTIVRLSPIVSVDLIIIDPGGYCLLGRRLNKPAKGDMFVPGGRIFKNETKETAVGRVLLSETGYQIADPDEQRFIGVYEHFYDDSFADDNESTHYVVLAYRITLNSRFSPKPDNQHDQLEWISVGDILSRPDVHENVKAYFR